MEGLMKSGLPPNMNRRVDLQRYERGHSTVVMVAPATWYWEGKTTRENTIVEVWFKDVVALAVPDSFGELNIDFADSDEVDRLAATFGRIKVGDRATYRLRDRDGRRGYVVAGSVYWNEKDVDLASEA